MHKDLDNMPARTASASTSGLALMGSSIHILQNPMASQSVQAQEEPGSGSCEPCAPGVMQRILVVGCPGSGKSTFSRALREKTGLPLYYLDMLWHRPDHTTDFAEVFDARLQEILDRPRWIIDGNYQRTLKSRLARADTVFFFDLPTSVCLQGIRNRIGQDRPDMPWPTETELDPEFEQYVRDFAVLKRPLLLETLQAVQGSKQIFAFRTRSDVHRFLDSCGESPR